jgi:hypothetical protein
MQRRVSSNESLESACIMNGEPVVIGGLPIPSDAPLFLTALGVHVLFGLAAVVTGAVAIFSKKMAGRHPRFGTYYFWCLAVVFVSAAVLSAMRWTENYHLFALGVLSFSAGWAGRTARRRRWSHWLTVHISGLGMSYVLLLTAFYVDNGPHLPLWNQLPPIAFWVLPAALGVPAIAWALLRHPLTRSKGEVERGFPRQNR